MNPSSGVNIQKVKAFWEANPLWTGESKYTPGTKEFFEEHRKIVLEDCFAGKLDERAIPKNLGKKRVLDLGCGLGFWSIELFLRGCKNIVAVDLTESSLSLTKKRCSNYGVKAKLSVQNAEELGLDDETFSHVNCHGVIHHTPETDACIKEIHRVLEKNGTACISVYFLNIFLRLWPLINFFGKIITFFGAGLRGRGRERIYEVRDCDELVRLYDGIDNPIGKYYTMDEFKTMLEPYFKIEEVYLHYFPARTLPFKLPKSVHRFLDRHSGFLVYANLKKR